MPSPERWLPIPGYEGHYEVSEAGRIRSLDRYVEHSRSGRQFVAGRVLVARIDRKGYWRLTLSLDGHVKCWAVHRALMAAFMPRPDWQQMHVNHKDGVTTNNSLQNLEWCTASENRLHSYRVLGTRPNGLGKLGALHPGATPVVGRCIKTGESRSYPSTADVAKDGFKPDDVCACANGRQKSHQGWMWVHAKDLESATWVYAPTKRSGATHHSAKPVERVAPDGSVKRYGSAALAGRDGFKFNCISHVLNGRNATHAGYVWRYAE